MYKVDGKAGESHIVFWFSAELLQEDQTSKPWQTPAEGGKLAEVLLEWAASKNGKADVILAFDGRSKVCRTMVDTAMAYARHWHEIWITYKPSYRTGRGVAYNSDN